jgi:CDP-diacylglycerol--glycerol-3-phosphate 3-phosphatidyltransferase
MNKKNIPNIITILRGILTIIIIILFLIDAEQYMSLILILFIIASISDFLDGYLARKWNIVSDFGKTADPLLDKILVFSLLILIFEFNIVPKIFIIILILRDLTIDSIRSAIIAQGNTMPAIFSAKLKTTFQMFMIIFVLLALIFPQNTTIPYIAISASILAIITSLFSGYIYIKTFINSTKK